jgi:hypothetical protein
MELIRGGIPAENDYMDLWGGKGVKEILPHIKTQYRCPLRLNNSIRGG